MDKVKQGNFLALCLLDALEDGNERICLEFLINHKTDPNHIVYDRGIAPIHYVCGMENEKIANKIMTIMLQCGGNPNLATVDDKMTAMHISAMYGRIEIFNSLLEFGGNINQMDGLCRLPIHYAIFEEQFDIVKRIQIHENYLRSQNATIANKNDTDSSNKSPHSKHSTDDKTIKGTEISVDKPETTENIFTLTRDNLLELSKNISPRKSTKSIVASWREKVQRSKSRRSILATYDNVDTLLSAYMVDTSLNFSNTDLTENNVEG